MTTRIEAAKFRTPLYRRVYEPTNHWISKFSLELANHFWDLLIFWDRNNFKLPHGNKQIYTSPYIHYSTEIVSPGDFVVENLCIRATLYPNTLLDDDDIVPEVNYPFKYTPEQTAKIQSVRAQLNKLLENIGPVKIVHSSNHEDPQQREWIRPYFQAIVHFEKYSLYLKYTYKCYSHAGVDTENAVVEQVFPEEITAVMYEQLEDFNTSMSYENPTYEEGNEYYDED